MMTGFDWNNYQTAPFDRQLTSAMPAGPQGAPVTTTPGTVPNSGVSGMGTGGVPTPTPQQAPTAGGQVTMQSFSDAWNDPSNPYPGTVAGLQAFMAAHPEYAAAGITLGGSKGDKVYGPGGAYWGDAVIGAGAGGQGKSRLSGETGGGQNGSTLGSLGYSFGSSMTPYTSPTAEQAINSPGLQFALKDTWRRNENGAAAKGTLLNGRFQEALDSSNIGNALQGFDQLDARMYRNHVRNQDAPFDKNYRLAELGRPS